MAAVLRVGFTPAGMQHDLEGVHPARASAERQDSHGAVRDRAQVQAWISQRFVRGQLVEGGPVHLREAHEQFHRDPALAGLEPGEGADRDTDQAETSSRLSCLCFRKARSRGPMVSVLASCPTDFTADTLP